MKFALRLQFMEQQKYFLFRRYETSSTTMSYTLFELSQNQAVQDKARDSVKKVLAKHGGVLTYEAIMDMHYIENCISGMLVKEF